MTGMAANRARGTLEKWILARGLQVVCDLQKSKGAFLHDALSGIDYLDFFSFYAARPLGFNHRDLADQAFVDRLARTALHKPSNCDVYTVEYAEFVERFATGPLGGTFRHVFFIEGGAPAVENAVKAAIDWKHRKNIASGVGSKGSTVLHFNQAFHGRTGYALSLTDSHDPRKTDFYPTFDWPRVHNPVMSFPFDDAAKTAVEDREQVALAEIDQAFERHPDDIAAIIIEPIQGEGGDNYFRTEFLQRLRELADQREVLLIFDEVQTGFGSTGAWWDWQNHEVTPDLLVFGKKTQVCGFAATARMDEVESVFQVPSRISSTFSGNLVDMVRCQRIIDVIERDDLLANTRTMGSYLLKLLGDLGDSYPQITGVRGRGGMAAFDLPSPDERDAVLRACFDEQLLLLPCGRSSLRLRPALDIDADAVGRAGAQLEAALRRHYGAGG